MTGAQIFQISIVIIYLIVLIIVGKKAGGQIKSQTDFHLAGRQMSWLIVAAGLVGTNYSGAVITSVSNFSYTYGLGGIWYEASTIIGFLICAFIYARRVRLCGAFTISELFEIKYGFNVRLIAGFFIMLSGLSASAAQFSAIGIITNTMFGIPNNLGIFISWIIILFYMVMGGFWAANLTNLPQLLFCFASFPVIAVWALIKYGGFQAIALAELPESVGGSYFSLFGAPLALVLTWVLQWMWMNEWGSQWYFQRASASRNVWHAKFGFGISAAFLTVGVLIPVTIIGLMARVVDPNLASGEVSLSMMIALSPVLLGGIATAGVFAAAMSTVDGCSMGAITVIVRDFYQRVINPNATTKQVTVISRIVTACVMVAILLFATSLKSVWSGLSFIFVFSTGLFGPLVAALFWKKASKEGALISIVVAGVVSIYWTFTGGGARFNSAWWAVVLSVCLMVIISLIVSKTGPWWGKAEKTAAKPELLEEITDFLSNRKATMADIIDRTGANVGEIKLALGELVINNKLVEIDYMTYCLKENCTDENVFTKDSSTARDIIMIIVAIITIIGFAVIWNITA
ncbi:MAG: sodium:solute symporter family protein [Clostridiales bacterium]|nr:sodium:solute symporter family protein [Clostridiales bacterium]